MGEYTASNSSNSNSQARKIDHTFSTRRQSSLNPFCFAEFTTMAGRRLREAVKETLISNGNGEFDDDTHVVIAGLTNTYSQYVATFEEYEQQRYEAASTLYGPHTLSAYIQEFKKLASAIAKGEKVAKPIASPPDLSSVQLRLVMDPFGESPPDGVNFGDIQQDVELPKDGWFKTGSKQKPTATFWSANPRFDLLTEGTYALVERLEKQRWTPAYDDDDFSVSFKWKLDNTTLINSLATIEWDIPIDADPGVYRLRHFGSSRSTINSTNIYFTGASRAFAVF
uniref:ceramidase n=1 Tax=Cucumis melo TaxID=3656 RepID=A0A9I9E8W9_CUCME